MMCLSFFLLFFVPLFVYGVSNSSVSLINKDPCHYCNIDLNCHYTDLGNAVKSLESKVDSLFKQNNKSFGIGNAIKSLEAKVESLTGLSNKTSSVGASVKTLEEKMESFLGLNNRTFGIGDAVKSLDANVEGFSGLINKTSGVADALKSLEVKMDNVLDNKTLESKIESLSELRNRTSRIGDAVKSLEAKVENLTALIYRTSLIPQPAPNRTASDRWQKLNHSPVCFGAKGDQFGNFSAPAGRLAAIKLVYLYGYVSCSTLVSSYPVWSYWGCGVDPRNVNHRQVNVVITNSSNHILLPPNQFIGDVTMKWYTIPGYNSLSPELVLPVFLNPISLSSNQVLRLWYGEDLTNVYEGDNGGRVCADVYSTYD